MSKWKGGKPTTSKSAAQLTAEGYRRTSNAYGLVSRIDRPDWLEVLADSLPGRCVADFCTRSKPSQPSPSWCDYYRRVLSKDTHTVDQERAKLIPASGFDPCGYVEVSE